MKKLISIVLALILAFSAISVMAAPAKPGKPGKPAKINTDAEFFISLWGVQWDTAGDVQTRDTSHFSDDIGWAQVVGVTSEDFTVVIGGDVTEEDLLSYLDSSPEDKDVFRLLYEEYSYEGATLYTDLGVAVDWENFTEENYETEWYVLKLENDCWHVDGRIKEIATGKNINIVTPEDEEEFFETVVIPEQEKQEEAEEEIIPEEEPVVPEVEEEVVPEEEPVVPEVEEEVVPEEEPVIPEEEPEEEDESIHLEGAEYAYIFGYEPAISAYTDELGNICYTAEIEMGMDDDVTVEQVCAMIIRMLDQNGDTASKSFPVTSLVAPHRGQWYERGIAYLASVGGFDDVDAIRTEPITRGQVAKLIACGLNLNLSEETPFEDVEGHKYQKYIEKVYRYGYMNGMGNGKFAPDRIMTRAEFCSLFNNIIDRNSCDLIAIDENGEEFEITAETYYFVDMRPSHWAYEICLKASSAYDAYGYIDLDTRLENIRNVLDRYDAQKKY